ncbi:hypothetical protein H6G89_31375 [Oscillatoria sp. FACHB-1407]|uniref:hypothetical protein n=1 Tax=Oscillatoria sp. FACHB-1407 TaxID=2692847 RepID=UPI0016826B5D|nr:hypothetical protein [Oscillatoria sp. FACHB-1407]MBD2465501.1 hypothetical protein [Oscillatoria sp. FACHB-1407]
MRARFACAEGNADWSQTPLGAVETWSPSLVMMVRFLLTNRFPLMLWWGPDYIQFDNDSYCPILGTKHPNSLGQAGSQCWTEIWQVISPLIDRLFQGGTATWMEDILLEIDRHGFVEETHFTCDRQRPRLRRGTSKSRSPGRTRSRQNRFLQQCLP